MKISKSMLIVIFLCVLSAGTFFLFKNIDHKAKDQNMYTSQNTIANVDNPVVEGTVSAQVKASRALIKTEKGGFTIKFYPSETPLTVANFVQKAQSGYYQGLTFHRVEDWVVQGGDPLGNGTGGGDIKTELSNREFKEGSVGVARAGNINISNDSQFFICTKDCSWLTKQYTNFGEVIEGMETVKKIVQGEKILSIELLNP